MFWKIVLLIVAIVLLTLNGKQQYVERKEYFDFKGNQFGFCLGTIFAVCLDIFLSWYVIDFFITLLK